MRERSSVYTSTCMNMAVESKEDKENLRDMKITERILGDQRVTIVYR